MKSYGFTMVGASRFERPTTRTPSEYATRLRHAPISLRYAVMHANWPVYWLVNLLAYLQVMLLFQQFQYLPDLLLRRFQDRIHVLTPPAPEFLPGTGNGVAVLV